MVLFDNQEVETDPCNKSVTILRQCYTNEVKSAKELKIYLKQEIPKFYPNLAYQKSGDGQLLDMQTRKPPAIYNPAT